MLLTGWFQASGRATLNAQIGPADIAVGGAVLFCAANVMWIMRGRRALGERIRLSLEAFDSDVAGSDHGWSAAPVGEFDLLVAAPGTRHFHRKLCYMVAGRERLENSEEGHRDAGRKPCGVCRP
jgi:hypothetical protein